jgi:hypothetical protein
MNNDINVGIWYSVWYAKSAENSCDNKINTWTAWNIPYKPLMPDGRYDTYDSLDKNVADCHIKEISEAGIDFIIMDQTNNIDVDSGYINERAIFTALRIMLFNNNLTKGQRRVRYCSAVGGIQFSGNAANIEEEAKKIYTRYNMSEDYHYYLNGKPLLIIYFGNIDVGIWENYSGDTAYADKFTIRYANNDSIAGYYGWAFDKGTGYNDEVMVVMPGWDNMKGAAPVKRSRGKWYADQWKKVLNAGIKPRITVINSFNEYAEGTAVFPADTSRFPSGGDVWINSAGNNDFTMYWEMTKTYIKQLRGI